MIEAELDAILRVDAITDIVGDRIYPIIPDEDASLPFVVFSSDLTESLWSLNGPMQSYRYQITVEVFAVRVKTVSDIAKAVRSTLDGHKDQSFKHIRLTSGSPIVLDVGYGYSLTFESIANI